MSNSQQHAEQIAIIADCIDNLAGYPYLATFAERFTLARYLVGQCDEYPAPERSTTTPRDLLVAYSLLRIARHTLELALLGNKPYFNVSSIVGGCFEAALEQLIDNKANDKA